MGVTAFYRGNGGFAERATLVADTVWPIPEPLLRRGLGSWLWRGGFPEGIVDYLKYPVTLSGERFVEETGFEPRYSLADCFDSMRSR